MTKLHNQEIHDTNAEYLQKMSKSLGHHSWWYTNRSSEDCINVKMHCYPDINSIINLLTTKEKQAVKVLAVDVDQYVSDHMWQDIDFTRHDFLQLLQEQTTLQNDHARIESLDYGGRSGGWLAVVFDFDHLSDYIEGYEYTIEHATKKEHREWCKSADNALAYIEKVHQYIIKLHREYCTELEDPTLYVEPLKDHIYQCIEHEQDKINLAAKKLKTLASN